MLSGLLVLDKPVGPTSHDVVACARRVLGEPRVGHTGTLDPNASGVLPLVVGRATRLARFLSAVDKTYEAEIRLGVATDTYDSAGEPLGERYSGPLPGRETIERALDAFRGTYLQRPPAFSAKRIGGQRSHRMARASKHAAARDAAQARGTSADPERGGPAGVSLRADDEQIRDDGRGELPMPVTVSASVAVLALEDDLLSVRVACSAGFYIRSLAHDLGACLGTGAHLAALRRTRHGDFTVSDAVPLEVLLGAGGKETAGARLVPLAQMLPGLDAVTLTEQGVRRAGHGRDLATGDFTASSAGNLVSHAASPSGIRLIGPTGDLVGVAAWAPGGLLHPCVVLV
jgi:tRNA pseudouridine55 synthase